MLVGFVQSRVGSEFIRVNLCGGCDVPNDGRFEVFPGCDPPRPLSAPCRRVRASRRQQNRLRDTDSNPSKNTRKRQVHPTASSGILHASKINGNPLRLQASVTLHPASDHFGIPHPDPVLPPISAKIFRKQRSRPDMPGETDRPRATHTGSRTHKGALAQKAFRLLTRFTQNLRNARFTPQQEARAAAAKTSIEIDSKINPG
jgi:hypothetical protein